MEYDNYEYEDWLKESWTHHALDLLNEVRNMQNKKSINLIIRHSHRRESNNAKVLINMGLTDLGKMFAIFFGKNLPINKMINIYHSISPRCIETAEMIKKGADIHGNNINIHSSLRCLYDLGTKGEEITKEMIEKGGCNFITIWKNGGYPKSIITLFIEYFSNTYKELSKIINNNPIGSINIFITHDIHIMALKLGLYGIQDEKCWPSFMGGFFV